MSQSPGRSSATVTLPYAAAPSTPRRQTSDALPPYLGRHIQLGFTQDDVAALISSIDSSQAPLPESAHGHPTLARLPAELLLQVLEHVPVDHVLDWRLVCRGFRDAIDGRVLYHCVQRTQLVGYVGPRDDPRMDVLDDEEYEAVHLIEADFVSIEQDAKCLEEKRPIWSGKHAVFRIKDEWYRAFRTICGLETQPGDTLNGVAPQWLGLLDRLAMLQNEELYGLLRWCIRLDHAVLDLDFPVDINRLHFDFDVNLRTGLVRVAWKDMLVRFLKTERALRILMDEKRDSRFTFSHHEDCLRSIRRTRLLSSLTTTQLDNTIRWAMRPLTPLFGIPSTRHASSPLTRIENVAISVLLLLRRTAALSPSQLSYLRDLHATYQALESSLRALDATYTEFKSYMSIPGFQTTILLPSMISNAKSVPGNPVAWSDELRVRIECQVARWKQQAGVMEKVRGLLEGSCEAMAAPEDGFDELGSDF
ncbi:hypothetical protein ACET3X_004580 [Alternaria dauci]|uniref:F-box domain-containing protein n=1 Tax=Alternaria dauci TaxID=48095 RepID=A0ABR3UQT6_9PLEO